MLDQRTDDIIRAQVFAEATRDHELWVPREGIGGVPAVAIYAMSVLDQVGQLDCTSLNELMPASGTRPNLVVHLAAAVDKGLVRKAERSGREQPYVLTDKGRRWLGIVRAGIHERRATRRAALAA